LDSPAFSASAIVNNSEKQCAFCRKARCARLLATGRREITMNNNATSVDAAAMRARSAPARESFIEVQQFR
jgi:hypothetical protein